MANRVTTTEDRDVAPPPPPEDRDVSPPAPQPEDRDVSPPKRDRERDDDKQPVAPPIEPVLGEGPPPPAPPPAPKTPDEPGGQVATVDGKQRYIQGSTMFEMGFRTPQESSQAQGAGVTYGTHGGKHVPEGSVLVKIRDLKTGKMMAVRYSGETSEKHPDISKAVLTQVRKGKYFVPVKDSEGNITFMSAERVKEKMPEWTQAQEFQMQAAAQDMAAYQRKVELYDIALADYKRWQFDFRAAQRAEGYSDKRIREQLAEIEGGKHLVYSPEVKKFVPTYREVVEQREIAGYTAKDIDEIYSGKWTIIVPGYAEPVNVTKAQYLKDRVRNTVLSELKKAGYEEKPSVAPEYLIGDAPFPAHLAIPPVSYNIIAAIEGGFDRKRLVLAFGEDIVKEAEQMSADFKLFEQYGSYGAMEVSKDKKVVAAARRLKKRESYLPPRALAAMKVPKRQPIALVEKRWMNTRTGALYTDSERRNLLKKTPAARDELVRSPESLRADARRLVTGPAELGVTFIGDKRVSIGVSEEVKDTADIVAAYLKVFGGEADAQGNTLLQQMDYLESLSKEGFIKNYFQEKGWDYGIHRGVASQVEIRRYDKRLREASKASGITLSAVDMVSPDMKQSMLRLANMVSIFTPQAAEATVPSMLYAVGSVLPISSTILAWNNSGSVMRGINIAIDTAIMFPFMKVGMRNAINAINKATRPGKAAVDTLRAAESQAAKEMAKVLKKTYGKEAADAFTAVQRAQSEYIARLYEVIRLEGRRISPAISKINKAIDRVNEQLRVAKAAQNWSTVRKLENTLNTLKSRRMKLDPVGKAQASADAAATKLEGVVENYKDIIKRVGAFDDTLTIAALDEMPGTIVGNTEIAVRDVIGKATMTAKKLQKQLTKVEAQLTGVQRLKTTSDVKIKTAYDTWQRAGGKHNTPEHRIWSQLMERSKAVDKKLADKIFDQATIKNRLEALTTRKISDIGAKLATKRTELTEIQARLQRASAIEAKGGHTEPPAYTLKDRMKKIQLEVAKLETEYQTAFKALKTEMRVKFKEGDYWERWIRHYAVKEEPLIAGRSRVLTLDPSVEISPALTLAMRAAGRARVPTRAGAPARRLAIHLPLADAVATTSLSAIRTSWKLGEDEFTRISPMVREAITTQVSPLIREFISPEKAAAMSPAALRAIEAALKAGTQAAINAAIQGMTRSQIEAATRAAIQSSVKAITDPAIKPLTKAQVKPLTKAVVKTATEVATRVAPIKPVIPPPILKPRPPLPTRLLSQSPASQRVPGGSVAFRMGTRKGARGIRIPQWYFIPPPYNQSKPIPMSAPPLGAINIDNKSPYATIQVIGRSRTSTVPASISIDMGITDAFITNYGRKISFTGKGTKTDVGARLPETTRGMSVNRTDFGDVIDDDFGDMPVSNSVSRVRMKKTKPPRKRKKLTEYEYMTTLKGFRIR